MSSQSGDIPHGFSNSTDYVELRDTNEMIKIFYRKIDGLHLEVAHRVINGWTDEHGRDCINATLRDGRKANHIPDSAWAVLQMVFNYFELIARFKLNNKGKPQHLFKLGVIDVFPEFRNHQPDIADILWQDVRTRLYHTGLGIPHSQGNKNYPVSLWHTDESKPIEFDKNKQKLMIDPHKLIPFLRQHLKQYIELLNDGTQIELRDKFRDTFIKLLKTKKI